ncbi:hypothetical protein D3C87_75560 [compost metagenome]
MKKLAEGTSYKVAQEVGKLFDLKVVGVKGSELINQINEQIDILNSNATTKPGKWYETEEVTYKEDDVVEATAGWANGRTIKIVKPSAKRNAFKGYLLNKQTGEPQGTLVTVDEKDIKPYVKAEVQEQNEAV